MTKAAAKPEIRTLDAREVDAVAGGFMPMIDISGMPDRAVGGCGTMWILRNLGRISTIRP